VPALTSKAIQTRVWIAFLIASAVKQWAREFCSGCDTAFGKPALVHFQYEADWFGCAMRVGGLWLHICQIDDGAVIGHKGSSEWQQFVFHPETQFGWLAEYEDHSFVLWHFTAKHESDRLLLLGLRDLRINLVNTCAKPDVGQIQLG